MNIKRFNVVCLITALIGYMSIEGLVAAFIIPILAVSLGLVAEFLIKFQKEKIEENQPPKADTKSITHYILTLASLLMVFYFFYVFRNSSYGFHIDGNMEWKMSFWGIPFLPDTIFYIGRVILPVLLIIFAVFRKSFTVLITGIMTWMYIIEVNTSKVFGDYKFVAAAGNDVGCSVIVSDYSNTVVNTILILFIVMAVISVLDFIIIRHKKPVLVTAIIISAVVGIGCSCMGYVAHNENKTYDVVELKEKIYGSTMESSAEFQEADFSNNYGSADTTCAHNGCHNFIVSSGNSMYCAIHSNKCLNCDCYIDGDAMYCMDCIEKSLK